MYIFILDFSFTLLYVSAVCGARSRKPVCDIWRHGPGESVGALAVHSDSLFKYSVRLQYSSRFKSVQF